MVLALGVAGAQALDLTQKKDFDIAPQRMATALLEFSHQAGVQVVEKPLLGDTLLRSIRRALGD